MSLDFGQEHHSLNLNGYLIEAHSKDNKRLKVCSHDINGVKLQVEQVIFTEEVAGM